MKGTSRTGTRVSAYRLKAAAILRLGIVALLSLLLVSVPIQAAPPVANDDAYTVDEDSLDNRLDVLSNDEDPDGDALQIVAVTQGLVGVVTVVDGGARVSYTPGPQHFGSDHFTYTVDDGNGGSATAQVNVTISGINDAPWIDPPVPDASADEDVAIVLDLGSYEHDVESSGVDLDWTVSGADHCTVTGENSDDDVLSFTPDANYDESDTILLTLSDPDGGADTQSIVLTWHPVNDAPALASLPDRSLDEDASLDNAIDLWDYASDPETADGGLSFAIEDSPDPNAGVTVDGNRYVDIRPAANWHGAVDVRIRVIDAGGLSDAATFRVTVRAVNDAPVATDNSFLLEEDSTGNPLYPLVDDSDIEGDRLTIVRTSSPSSGTVTITEDGTALAYTPDPNSYGQDHFTYTIGDGNGGSDTAAIDIQVENVNDDPVAEGDRADIAEDSGFKSLYVLANDTYLPDPVETLTIASASPPAHGSLSIATNHRYLRYKPDPDYYGPDAFTYTVIDGNGGSAKGQVNVSVRNVNDDPRAIDDQVTVAEDSYNVRIDVLDNDSYLPDPPETLTIVGANGSAHGEVRVADGGTRLEYTPDKDYYGGDGLTYTIDDSHGGRASGTVAITVRNVNDDPVARRDRVEIDEDSGANPIEVLANDTYEPDPPETLTIVGYTSSQYGTVTIVDGGARLTYQPKADYDGTDAFAYTISDDNGGYATASINVTVRGINDLPKVKDDRAFTNEDIPVTIDVLQNDDDVDGNLVPSTMRIISEPSHGSTSVDTSNGQVTYTPAPDWNGNDILTYYVCDDGTPLPSQCDTAMVTVFVRSVNDPPISDAGPDRQADTLSLVALDGSGSADPDDDYPLTYLWSQIGGPVVTLSRATALTPIFAAPDDPCVLTFTLRVIDFRGLADNTPDETVVTILNQLPIADAGPDRAAMFNSLVTLDGSGSTDHDNDRLTYFWSQVSGPTVALSNKTAEKPTFIAPDVPCTLTFALSVTDAFGGSDLTPDEVVVQVNTFHAYMPVIQKRYAVAPDLVIHSLTANSNGVQLAIYNQGNAPVRDAFWIDVYIDPRTAPTHVNQTWLDLGDEGLVWAVTGDGLARLTPGGSLTLGVGDPYYRPSYSDISWPLHPGTPVYAQVDSYSSSTNYGTVLEIHELLGGPYNNIPGPIAAAAGATAETTPFTPVPGPVPLADLPPRP